MVLSHHYFIWTSVKYLTLIGAPHLKYWNWQLCWCYCQFLSKYFEKGGIKLWNLNAGCVVCNALELCQCIAGADYLPASTLCQVGFFLLLLLKTRKRSSWIGASDVSAVFNSKLNVRRGIFLIKQKGYIWNKSCCTVVQEWFLPIPKVFPKNFIRSN